MPLGRSNPGQTPPEAELESGRGAVFNPQSPSYLQVCCIQLAKGEGSMELVTCCLSTWVSGCPPTVFFLQCGGEFFWVCVNSEQLSYEAFKTFGAG